MPRGFDGHEVWKIDVFNGETAPHPYGRQAAPWLMNAMWKLENVFINYKAKGTRPA